MLKNTKICINATHKSNLYLMCEIDVREYQRGNKKMDNNEKIDYKSPPKHSLNFHHNFQPLIYFEVF
jgi:hypothetical protein